MGEWIEANLEPAEGQSLDLSSIVDRFTRQSTRAERREVPDPEAALRELLPTEGQTILNHRIKPDMVPTENDREPLEGGKWRRSKHVSAWN